MMPGLLTKLGLYEAVEDLFENLNDMENLTAVVEIAGEQDRLPENKEIMLYRVVQEMVNNTLKHAKASEIRLTMQITPEKISLVYSDNGIGFDPKTALSEDSESLGLKSIQSRVSFLGGRVEIESSPGSGAVFNLEIPV
jgi:signal transduction histidine kinase